MAQDNARVEMKSYPIRAHSSNPPAVRVENLQEVFFSPPVSVSSCSDQDMERVGLTDILNFNNACRIPL